MGGRAYAQGSAAPPGSYLKTCGDIHMNGTILTASCQTDRHSYPSSLNVAFCGGGDIWNYYGGLYCHAKRGTWGQGRAIPQGSYIDSCYDMSVGGSVLQGKCKDRSSKYRSDYSRLDMKSCRTLNNITNLDGQLICIN
jgi:hypothetical protein